MWTPQVPALSTDFQVLRYNTRGHGGSPAPPGPYEIADLAGDLLELLDSLEVERASICGVSIGGMAGMWVGANPPQRLDKPGVCAPSAAEAPPGPGHRRAAPGRGGGMAGMWIGANAPERMDKLVLCATSASMAPPEPWHERAALVRAEGMEPVIDATVERWFTPEFVAAGLPVVARTRATIASTDPEAYASCCEAIAGMDLREDVRRIQALTLVIAGADDPAAPPEAGALIAERIQGARLEVIPDARHLVSLQRPEIVTPLILEHLQESR